MRSRAAWRRIVSGQRKDRRPNLLAPLAAVSLALTLAGPALAGTISLAWDPVPDSDLQTYRLFVGSSPGAGDTAILDVGNVTAAVLTGLPDCTVHYVAVKAVDRAGNVSMALSNTIAGWTQPRLTGATPSRLPQGTENAVVRMTGASFTPGMGPSDVQFDDSEVRVLGVTTLSCTEIEVVLSTGPFVLNPGDPGYNGSGGAVEEVAPAQVGLDLATISAPDGSGAIVRGTPAPALTVDLMPSLTDTDGNGVVDGFDLARLGRAFGSDLGTTGWDPAVDFNGDETTDGLDLSIIASYFAHTF
jgi:dockerin type I repeat protein